MVGSVIRRWRRSLAVLASVLVVGWAATIAGPHLSVWWTLRGLDSPDPAVRAGALEGLRPAAREGRLDPSRVAACIVDPDASVRAQAAQVLLDTGNLRAFCSAALDRPTARTTPVVPPSIFERLRNWLAPPAPVKYGGRIGGRSSSDDDRECRLAFQECRPEDLVKVLTRAGHGYGFGCARMPGMDGGLVEAASKASNPDARLLALTLLVLHHSNHGVAESVALVEALPEPEAGDPAAPAVRFLREEGFCPRRVLEALASSEEREQSWGMLVICARPRPEYRDAVTAHLAYDDKEHPLHAPGILAARALGAIGGPGALEVLRRTALEGHYVQRREAIRAVGRLSGVDPQPLWLEVLSRAPQSLDDWESVCACLAERGDAAALPALEAALQADLGKRWHASAVGATRAKVEKAIEAIRARLAK